jgi:hypothetical protein
MDDGRAGEPGVMQITGTVTINQDGTADLDLTPQEAGNA